MTFLFAIITFDIAQVLDLVFVFLSNFSDINPNGLIASSTVAMMLSRGLDLSLICVSSRKGIVGLSFIFVPITMLLIGLVFIFFS